MKRDLISFSLWSREALAEILELARSLSSTGVTERPLEGATVALVFERESLRTRVSFEGGIAALGGHPVFLQQQAIGIVTRESVHDIAVTLSQYCRIIVARTTRHQTLVQIAESATIPVVNALTDLLHPCQILADAYTLQTVGRFSPAVKIVIIGDGNSVANSWLELAEKFPLHLVFSCPHGYEPHPGILEQAINAGVSTIEIVHDPYEAVREADVIYTDVWLQSRGSVDEQRRLSIFRPFQVNQALLNKAHPHCLVMHRLPANRGEEITSDVLDGKNCIALVQARNRKHVQEAIMMKLIG